MNSNTRQDADRDATLSKTMSETSESESAPGTAGKKQGSSRIEIRYSQRGPLLPRLRRAAVEHGYAGRFGHIAYGLRFLFDVFLRWLVLFMPLSRIRIPLHRARGVRIGKNVLIGYNVTIDDVYPRMVTIGDGVALSDGVFLVAHSKPPEYFEGQLESFVAPVTVKDNVWIGVGAIVLPGVTVGEGSIISAGSLVTRDVRPHWLVAGNPARHIQELKPHEGHPEK
jgi:acetyltransferase-like isoleucine patch superfamily enzyme